MRLPPIARFGCPWGLVLVAILWPAAGCTPARNIDAASGPPPAPVAGDSTGTLDFARILAHHQGKSAPDRDAARDQALAIAEFWRDFELEAHEAEDAELRHWFYSGVTFRRAHHGTGLGNSILELRRAVEVDPSFAEGWGALGRLCAEAGDLTTARSCLDNARTAAAAAAQSERPLAPEVDLQIHRERAWVLRDLALWDEGLAAVAEGLAAWPADPDLTLVQGLLLAGAGRCVEAMSIAVRMDPVEYPQFDFIYRGFKMQRSSHANNWIRAMALLTLGDVKAAYARLGDLPTYAYRTRIAHSPRFWRDAGLLAELVADPKAPTYYAVGFITRHYQLFYPAEAANVGSLVLGVPDPAMPVFTSFGHRFFIGGSPFSYVGLQMNNLRDSLVPAQRGESAGRALQMLEILERRGVSAPVCRALRGRILYALDRYEAAQEELLAAREAFACQGRTDAGTSLLLGLLGIQVEDFAAAAAFLEESIAAEPDDPVAWRSLGVACSRSGRLQEAGQAMTRAVELDPWNVTGLYNRALLRYQTRQPEPALLDLDRALALDPANRQVQHLRTLVAAEAGPGLSSTLPPSVRTRLGPVLEESDPAELLAFLQADIDRFFTVPDSLKVTDPEAEARIQTLYGRYLEFRDPALRAVLALALIDLGRFDQAQALLAPGWGVDLIPEEELMLLYADGKIGERARAEQVMRQVLDAGDGGGNPYAVAQAARSMRTGSDPVGTDPRNRAAHGFFDWWTTAKTNRLTNPSGRPRFVADLDLFRKYASEALFDEAVWGMMPTPAEGWKTGVGSGTVGK